jgi:hypothetical protein
MADPDVESLANEMAVTAMGLAAVEAIGHLESLLKDGCDPAGEHLCNWCGGGETSHEETCPYPKAKAFLSSLK